LTQSPLTFSKICNGSSANTPSFAAMPHCHTYE
jgi:hypothetical protein